MSHVVEPVRISSNSVLITSRQQSCGCRFSSVVGAPVAVVTGHEAACDEQDKVHKPPDPQTSQSQQLPHRRARVAQAEAIHAEASQEEGVEQRGDKVVSGVSVEGH